MWDSGDGHMYRMGADGKFDLSILSMRSFTSASQLTSHFSRSVSSPAANTSTLLTSSLGGTAVISRANKFSTMPPGEPTTPLVYTSSITRVVRPAAQQRVSASTLSLPETTAGSHNRRGHLAGLDGGSSVLTEQTVSADQLDRAVEVGGSSLDQLSD